MGLERHIELFTELGDLDRQMRALRARQVWILEQLEKPT
jgi:hypothetical protein